MPLFFLIAIGAGAFTVGATTTDVLQENRNHTAQVAPAPSYQATAYSDCVNAAVQQGLSAANCQRS